MYKIFLFISIYLLASSITYKTVSAYELYRLPKSITPEHYKLQVLTHLDDDGGADDFKFYGKVWIKIFCTEDTRNITLHSKNLNLTTSKIELNQQLKSQNIKNENDGDDKEESSKKVIEIENTWFDLEHEFFVIHTKELLTKGSHYELYIPFDAELNLGLLGYYRSNYVDKQLNKTVWLAVTQFEATYARRAFPCFDEPEMKAKFEIILGHDKKYTALSNMPIKHSYEMKDKTNWVWDHFEESVPMSTYLVAYTINDFEYKESTVKMTDDIVFRIWARRDAIDQVEYAKMIGPKVLKFYEEYFDVKFPLPKMDMIAIPDFSAGAMENWGLVTYRETALLFQPNVSASSSQHRVASVIAHELAHQWFGNLVTMKWWTDLWLNEGFATYVASLGVNYLHPEWNSFDEESVDNTLSIFKLDALKSSHPVSIRVGDPSEISQIFDKISYEKGSSIIRMMHLFLGEDAFRWGVSNYIKKHKYGNAEQDNLWDCLTEEAHKQEALPKSITVKQIMDAWTLQTGYPIITVERDYDKGTADITQVRYLSDVHRVRSELETCWWVPLTYTSQMELDFNSTEPKAWLECDQHDNSITKTIDDVPESNEWILFNIKFAGLYKVKYDPKNWDLLIDQLIGDKYDDINTISRAQLIDDALDLAWSGDQDYGIALRVVQYLKQEKEYIPWKSALSNLNAVNRLLKRTPHYGLFRTYMTKILTPIYNKMGGLNADRKPNDHLDVVKHKVLIGTWACRFNVGNCQQESKQYFDKWLQVEDPDNNNPVPLDLRSIVYCYAIRQGNDKEWNFLWTRYTKSNVGTERAMILSSLGCSREIWILVRYLEWMLDESSGVRKQDAPIVFANIARGDIGFHLAKTFLMDRIEDIYKYLQPEPSKLGRFLTPLADQMSSEKELIEMKNFVQRYNTTLEKVKQNVKQSLETIDINNQWQSKNYNSIGRYLTLYS